MVGQRYFKPDSGKILNVLFKTLQQKSKIPRWSVLHKSKL